MASVCAVNNIMLTSEVNTEFIQDKVYSTTQTWHHNLLDITPLALVGVQIVNARGVRVRGHGCG